MNLLVGVRGVRGVRRLLCGLPDGWVGEDPLGLPPAVPALQVPDGWRLSPGDAFCWSDHPLKSFAVEGGAVAVPILSMVHR